MSRGERGRVKNLPFDEALDLSASDASVSRGPSEQRGDGAKGEVTSSSRIYGSVIHLLIKSVCAPFSPWLTMSRVGPSFISLHVPSSPGLCQQKQQGRPMAGAKGDMGIVKDKPFDEAHSIGEDSGDLSSEESIMTNDSEPKPRIGAAAPAAATNGLPLSSASAAAAQREC